MPRIVPYSSLNEWEDVYSSLYGRGPLLSKDAILIVKSWLLRGKVAHAIISTIGFVEVLELYSGFVNAFEKGEEFHISSTMLRMIFGLSFVRFVNGIVDAEQKGFYANTVAKIANEVGLPNKFVDLRHAATHDELPPLPELADSAKEAMIWLEKNYWIVQKNWEQATESDIDSLLTKYLNLKKLELNNEFVSQSTSALVEDITVLTSADSYLDNLIPILSKLLMNTKEYKDIEEVENFLKSISNEQSIRNNIDNIEIPYSLTFIWDEAIFTFGDIWTGFYEDIFIYFFNMYNEIKDESYLNKSLLMIYALYIFEKIDTLNSTIIRKIFSSPSIFTKRFIYLLKYRSDIPKECNIEMLSKLYTSYSTNNVVETNKNVNKDRINDSLILIKRILKNTNTLGNDDDILEDENNDNYDEDIEPWSISLNPHWKTTPIGCLLATSTPEF